MLQIGKALVFKVDRKEERKGGGGGGERGEEGGGGGERKEKKASQTTGLFETSQRELSQCRAIALASLRKKKKKKKSAVPQWPAWSFRWCSRRAICYPSVNGRSDDINVSDPARRPHK